MKLSLTFADGPWPPPDPDRIPRRTAPGQSQTAFTHGDYDAGKEEQLRAFRQRQQEDAKRFKDGLERASPGGQIQPPPRKNDLVEKGWQDSEGETLEDFGVDEEVELYEDDIPLGELLRRRRGHFDTSRDQS